MTGGSLSMLCPGITEAHFRGETPRAAQLRMTPGERSTQRMKKWMMILAGLPLLAGVAHAQESRQDFSVSYSGLIPPTVVGNAVHQSSTIGDVGVLGSYRYQLTP